MPGPLPSRLYPIIDMDVCGRRGVDPRDFAAGCLHGGARLLQLRVKSGPPASFLTLADALVSLAQPFRATVIVNDRADIARMAAAGGVHLGQEDLPPAEARRMFGEGWIGVSTHNRQQIDEATGSPADYVAVGPIFETFTKHTGYHARGLDLVRYAADRGKPVVAIGGIDLTRAAAVVAAGAAAIAVISDLFVGRPEDRVREYLRALG